MKKKGRIITALATTGAALALTITPALAATVYAQGGTWNYGVGNTYVWSYYSHNGRSNCKSFCYEGMDGKPIILQCEIIYKGKNNNALDALLFLYMRKCLGLLN